MTALDVALPSGAVRVTTAWEEPAAAPRAVVALAHGAGAGLDHPFLVGFAAGLRSEGFATLRFAFPYREAGRRMPGPAPHAVATLAAVAAEISRIAAGVPFVAAGKSYGGRMASMAVAEGAIEPAALVYLGYPFHAPGKPDKPRGAHLALIRPPQLFVEGDVDPFIQPIADFEASVATSTDAEIVWIPGGGHSFEVKGQRRPPDEVGAALAPTVAEWLRTRV